MAQPRIYFCQFKNSIVEPLAEFTTMTAAETCVRLHNNTIAGPAGELEDQFWFINQVIKSKSKIIVLARDKTYPANDPQFYDKLEPYLNKPKEDKEEKNKGSFKSRGFNKRNL